MLSYVILIKIKLHIEYKSPTTYFYCQGCLCCPLILLPTLLIKSDLNRLAPFTEPSAICIATTNLEEISWTLCKTGDSVCVVGILQWRDGSKYRQFVFPLTIITTHKNWHLAHKRRQFWFCCHMLSGNCQARPYLE